MAEMKERGYNVSKEWLDHTYRGKRVGYDTFTFTRLSDTSRYNEHNPLYYNECRRNLREKGIIIK